MPVKGIKINRIQTTSIKIVIILQHKQNFISHSILIQIKRNELFSTIIQVIKISGIIREIKLIFKIREILKKNSFELSFISKTFCGLTMITMKVLSVQYVLTNF